MTDDSNTPRDPYKGKKHAMPEGKGFRPSFHALWHLKALGVASLDPFESKAWEEVSKRPAVRVAVIDTPVAHRHPCLEGAIDLGLARDFSVHDTGAFIEPDPANPDDKNSRETLRDMVASPTTDLETAIRDEIDGKLDRRTLPPLPYGAHGTAIAGLIGARPATIAFRKTAFLGEANEDAELKCDFPLPYAGVNPFCRIVPISMTAAPNTRMILGALEYARLIRAEIVVIAAEWADEIDRDRDCNGWENVDAALLSLSSAAPVFCAAGNLRAGVLSYPASLSGRPDGARPWAVTACDENGRLLSYAPPILPGHRMLSCLSSEHPRYDRVETRLDPYAARDPELHLPPPADDYPARHIIATDPPGRWGYNPSPFEHDPTTEDEHYEIGSLFSRFSGTSAATALAAGLASIAIALCPPEDGTAAAQERQGEGEEGVGCFSLEGAKALVRG